MQIKLNYTPKPWQSAVHKGLAEHPFNSFHIVKSKRQCGKSLMVEMILFKAAVTNKNSISISVSPTLEQARKIFCELRDALVTTPLLTKYNEQRLLMKFWNGAELYFKSAEQGDALRGFTIKNGGVLCIDEAAFVSDQVFFIILPWVNVSRAPVVICSSPKFKTGFFYEFYKNAIEGEDNYYFYDWNDYDTSEFLSPEMLEMYRRQTPRQIFLTEFMGQFLDMESSVFGNFEHILNNKYDKAALTVMGIDWGSGSNGDYTSVSVLNTKKQMVDLVYFNDKDSTLTISAIADMIEKYRPLKVVVEKNSIGSVYYDLLKKEVQKRGIKTTSVIPFNTTNDSKYELVSMLQVAIQNNDIQLFNDPELINELSAYECKPSPTGKPTYNAALGSHDDLIMSTMLALHALKPNNSSVHFA